VVPACLLEEQLLVDEFPHAVEEHVAKRSLAATDLGANLRARQQQVRPNAAVGRDIGAVDAHPGTDHRAVPIAVMADTRLAGELRAGQLPSKRARRGAL